MRLAIALGEVLLFLKKKKQKDFTFPPAPASGERRNSELRRDKSLFASFSSEKEDVFLSARWCVCKPWRGARMQCYRPAHMQTLLSVVVPVRNEAPNIRPLIEEIEGALRGVEHEIVYVDDGSDDATPAELAAAQVVGVKLRVLRHRSGCGQSAAILTGVRVAQGHWIATLDGDGQNDPADIPALLARAEAEAALRADALGSFDPAPLLIVGHRTRRQDGWVKRISSRLANGIRAGLLGDATPDTGCGLKVFSRDAFLRLPAFDHMHRFLPALFLRAGGRVVSVPVNHRPRVRGASKYGTLDRLWVGVFDLVGVYWLQRRWKRPVVEDAPQQTAGVEDLRRG